MKRIVIAFGGNALEDKGSAATAQAQLEVAKQTCEHIADIVEEGYEVTVAHGNGPQVGRIVLAFEVAHLPMPFDASGAMSQGYIGYHIQQALGEILKGRGINTPVASLVTQVVVDEEDPAFGDPVKPIGAFYTEKQAEEMDAAHGYTMKEDSGRGWRRVIPSPVPKRIVEVDIIKQLMGKSILITVGGGGIPVFEREDGMLEGAEAVIDKDLASELLAEDIGADVLLILTNVENVAINFGKPNQVELSKINIDEASRYIDEGQFAPGSMLPKVIAAMKFVESGKKRVAVITSPDKAVASLRGEAGTVIS